MRALCLTGLLSLLCWTGGLAEEALSFPQLAARWEQQVASDFGKGMETYQTPTAEDLVQATRMAESLRRGDFEGALEWAREIGYSRRELDSGLVLFEDSQARGWGWMVFSPDSKNQTIIEVPHPVADAGTPAIAARLFMELEGKFFLMAGCHRRNRSQSSPEHSFHAVTDMTHTEDTIFQAWHQGAAAKGDILIQAHGFSVEKAHHRFPRFPLTRQVVLSDGADDDYDPPLLLALRDQLIQAGIDTSVPDFADKAGRHLGATTNVQRDDCERRGLVGKGMPGEFLHLEMSERLRSDPEQLELLVKTVTRWAAETYRKEK